MLVGRDSQWARLHAVLRSAARDQGGGLVLRGEAGIGKTALLAQAADTARAEGMRVVTAAGVQAEARIPYAVIHQLLRQVGVRFDPDGESSPYRIGMRALDRLGDLGEPVLLAVEDAHWADAPSWDALTFLGRRLESDRIALVMTIRDGDDVERRLAAAGLPEIRLDPLGPEPAAELLDRIVPGLSPALRARVLDGAAGNPLGLVELGEAAARSGAAALLPAALPLSTRVERTFSALVAELPEPTRALLLTAALDDGDALDEVTAATAIVCGRPVTGADAEPAVSTRLMAVDEQYRIQFRHPLLRSALAGSAAAEVRRATHAALARVLAAEPDRQIWHRAAAAAGPDEAIARDLAKTAIRAHRSQAAGVAQAALERAAQLSEDHTERVLRLLWAAEMASQQGDGDTVRRLLAQVGSEELQPAHRARYSWLHESFAGAGFTGTTRLGVYLDLIDDMRRTGDANLALSSLIDLSLRMHWSNPGDALRRRYVEIAEALDTPGDDYRALAAMATAAPIECGVASLERLERLRHRVGLSAVALSELGVAASGVGAFPLSNHLLIPSIADLSRQGRLGLLVHVLNSLAFNAAALGDARSALRHAEETVSLAAEIGLGQVGLTGRLSLAMAAALRGDGERARALADGAEAVFIAAGTHPLVSQVLRVRGVEALAAGRAEEAFRELRRMFDPADPAYHPYLRLTAVGHLAEAALLAGLRAELAPVVADLEPVAEQCRNPALLAGLHYAREVLADDPATRPGDDAGPDLAAWPFERARLALTRGTRLRRGRQNLESRPHLRGAAATFDALGATPWADRARAELRASGESLRRPVDATAALTEHELQVAHLAAAGLSNREIGERLFLSPRTISTHLYHIFPKLGVRSRGELAKVLLDP
ncbi:AAA family ATPase [Dactylosporangium sp. NPDC000244]|uniref:helix-turn-helix transcriptional regulator n=1 Tax=Dactylosporangium sp. NPDC000244 TaxID=3154365 RepID=UPI00331ADAAD